MAAVVDGRGAPARTDDADMTAPVECRYYGRDFTTAEMALLRELIAGPPALNRHALSKEFCRRIGWYKADGGIKDMMARVVMLAMHRDGRIELPPPKWRQNRPGPITFGPETEPPLLPPPTTLDAVRPLEMRTVVRGDRGGTLWNEYVARYHYLGYKTLVGAQMRYAVHASDGTPLAMLGFSTAAWTLAPRDRFIGWSRRQPAARRRQPALPDPALDPHSQPRLARPRTRPPPAAGGLDRALQDDPGAHRDLRGDAPLHRRRLPGLRLDPGRHHPGARTLRHEQPLRQAQEGHLAEAPPQGLAAHPQPPVESTPDTGTTERLPAARRGFLWTALDWNHRVVRNVVYR